jgi:hypothetical protein
VEPLGPKERKRLMKLRRRQREDLDYLSPGRQLRKLPSGRLPADEDERTRLELELRKRAAVYRTDGVAATVKVCAARRRAEMIADYIRSVSTAVQQPPPGPSEFARYSAEELDGLARVIKSGEQERSAEYEREVVRYLTTLRLAESVAPDTGLH